MARLFSNLRHVRQGFKGTSLYLAAAVAVFAVVVFLLFRNHSAGPQETAGEESARNSPAVRRPAESAPTLAAATAPGNDARQSPPSSASDPAPVPSQPAEAALSTPVVPPADPQTEAAIAEVLALIRSQPGEVVEVRNRLNKILQTPMAPQQRQTVKAEMAKLSEKWLFGPTAFPNDTLCDTYMVKRGDLLDIIGRRFKVPYEVLMQINSIPRPQALQAGQALKVVKGPFHAKVYRSTFTLDLYLQDTYVRSFKVGLGKPGYETPTGLWRVQEGGKLVKPTWTDPDTGRVYKASDADYPLGSRWIALDGLSGAAMGRTGFAIHGTKDPDQIGTAGSRGCIRMYNGDAVLMYNLLVPLYSQVEVFD